VRRLFIECFIRLDRRVIDSVQFLVVDFWRPWSRLTLSPAEAVVRDLQFVAADAWTGGQAEQGPLNPGLIYGKAHRMAKRQYSIQGPGSV
jgi:hypothetical protein